VFEAGGDIPDSDLLQARYSEKDLSLSDGDPVSTFTDETGNGNDLTGTAATFRANALNGNPVVRFDGVDDDLNTTFSSTLSQPNYIFMVARQRSAPADNFWIWGANDGFGVRQDLLTSSAPEYQLFAGSFFNDGAPDTNAHIFGGVFDGASSAIRLDGTQTATGDGGADGMPGARIGYHSGADSYFDIDVGEWLIYDSQPSIPAVASYLSDEWGITI